jgi:hypothetical protein
MGTRHSNHRSWTAQEDEILLSSHRDGTPIAKIAERLGRSEPSVHNRIRVLHHPERVDHYYRQITLQRQIRTQQAAKNANAPWEGYEDEFVMETLDEPAEEVALVLGRSYNAVLRRRLVLRNGGGFVSRPDRAPAPKSTPTCGRCGLQHPGEC